MTTSPTPDPKLLQPSPFLEVIIFFLTLSYLATTPDRQRSRADIIEGLPS